MPRRPAAASAWTAAPVSSIPDGAPLPAKLKPPSPLAWPATQRAARRSTRSLRRAAGRAQAEDRERGRVDPAGERAVLALLATTTAGDEVAPADPPRLARPATQDQDRALELAEVVELARVRADVVDDARAAALDVARVAPGRREPERGPAGVELRRALLRRAAEAAVGVLGALEPAQPTGRARPRSPRRGSAEQQRDQRRRHAPAPARQRDLEARPEAPQRAHERRAEREAEERRCRPRARRRTAATSRSSAASWSSVWSPQNVTHRLRVHDRAEGQSGQRAQATASGDAPELAAGHAREQRAAGADRRPRRPSATASTAPARRRRSRPARRPRRPRTRARRRARSRRSARCRSSA